MNFLLLTITLLLLATLQVRLPAILGLRLELLPALVAYGALTFRRGNGLLLALMAGFTQDALSAAPFGITALAYGIAALLLTALGEALNRELPPFQLVAGALVTLAAGIAASFFVGFTFKMILVAAITGLITPIFFFAADYFRYLVKTA
jgi:rod shape-determining protein MreD